jgi:hypothetical protein
MLSKEICNHRILVDVARDRSKQPHAWMRPVGRQHCPHSVALEQDRYYRPWHEPITVLHLFLIVSTSVPLPRARGPGSVDFITIFVTKFVPFVPYNEITGYRGHQEGHRPDSPQLGPVFRPSLAHALRSTQVHRAFVPGNWSHLLGLQWH